jgi:purine-binding chemotaxis protein CheW
MTLEHSKSLTELLAIRVGGQLFAFDIMSVREIRGWTNSTPLPHAPDSVKGMINLRGSVMVVLDLAGRLGIAANEPGASSVVVVVEAHNTLVGLLVDAVCDIISVTDDQIQPTPSVGGGATPQFVEGVISADREIIGLLSMDAVVPTPAGLAA